jgi:CRP-like cAMP-binding protein
MAKLWSLQRGADAITEIPSFLPVRAYADAVEELLADQLQSLFFLHNCRRNRTFRSAFASKLTLTHYLAGDYLFRSGEAADRLFFVVGGTVSFQKLEAETLRSASVNSVDNVVSMSKTAANALSTLLPRPLRNSVLALSTAAGNGSGRGRSDADREEVLTSVNERSISMMHGASINPSGEGGGGGRLSTGLGAGGQRGSTASSQQLRGTAGAAGLPQFKHRIGAQPLQPQDIGPSSTTMSAATTGIPQLPGGGRRKSTASVHNGISDARGNLQDVPSTDKSKTVSYSTVREGCIGEMECFTRLPFSCCAKATTDVVVFEIPFATIWTLLEDHRLCSLFMKLIIKEHPKLARGANCTLAVVSRLQANLKANKKMMLAFADTELLSSSSFVLMPDNPMVQIWRLCITTILVMQAVFIPYFIVFGTSTGVAASTMSSTTILQLVLDAVSCVMFAVDAYLSLYYLAVTVDGTLIDDPVEFTLLYRKNHLTMDMVSLFPLALLAFAATNGKNLLLYSLLRIPLLLRLRKATTLLSTYVHLLETIIRRKYSTAILRLWFTVALVLYIVHIFACLFCWIGMSESPNGWLEVNGLSIQNTSSSYIYMFGYYWAFYTIATVGYVSFYIPLAVLIFSFYIIVFSFACKYHSAVDIVSHHWTVWLALNGILGHECVARGT